MSFEIFIRALLALVIAVLLVRGARSLRSGRVNIGGAVYLREAEPRIFWTDLALDALTVLLLGWALSSARWDAQWPLALAVIAAVLVRSLLIRRKGARPRIFAQGAGEYLALALLYGLVLLAAIGLVYLFILRDL